MSIRLIIVSRSRILTGILLTLEIESKKYNRTCKFFSSRNSERKLIFLRRFESSIEQRYNLVNVMQIYTCTPSLNSSHVTEWLPSVSKVIKRSKTSTSFILVNSNMTVTGSPFMYMVESSSPIAGFRQTFP